MEVRDVGESDVCPRSETGEVGDSSSGTPAQQEQRSWQCMKVMKMHLYIRHKP